MTQPENEHRIVCWFSCGAASAVATKLAIVDNAGRRPLVVARCIVDEEHEDNERFSDECEEWFGVPILKLKNTHYGTSIYDVFTKKKYISGIGGAPCTLHLKKDVRIAFQTATDTHVFGYCSDELGRWNDFLDANQIDSVAPLIDRSLSHDDSLAIMERTGIALPVMYKLGYHHNNCIGCVKAQGQGYWNKIRIDFPNNFDRMAKFSRAMGVLLVKVGESRIFLDELQPGTGNYKTEPEIQCGIFCHMASQDVGNTTV